MPTLSFKKDGGRDERLHFPKTKPRKEPNMERLGDIIACIFTDPRPCRECLAAGPSFPEGGTGKPYCLNCLTHAVEEDIAEQQAQRQDMARMAAYEGRFLA